ncbi:mannose-6-phosphate receptor binding domain-containing protein [Naematelia encephala]|uniref:Mannose-6-phosphate receptor binding domain-containing protein n=1 Tax=Naematelia encephala TaxID=71784 RepID=A0A1Y2AY22_9TREE|nr:mannose-6-phosphate receptor binding domain-containing protein [Naematelia encephala]
MSADTPCTLTLADGTHYDLSSLASAKADYEAKVGETSYKLNVCRGVVSELWHLDDAENVGGFVSRQGGDFSLGRVNSTLYLSPASNEPMLYIQNGSPCPHNSDELASTAIRFICSPSDFHAGTPILVAALPPDDPSRTCHFFFEWSTHVACPTNAKAQLGTSHYVAFGAILFIAFLTWFGGHTIYNRFYLKRRGLDQFPIPKISLPSAPALSFRSDGQSTIPKPGGFWKRRSQRNGYTNIRADDNDEHEGFAGRFSLEEDDEDAEDLTGGGVDARALGGETHAWRGTARGDSQQGHASVGVHQGLVDV